MSRLLEILGKGMELDTADLIWHWLDIYKANHPHSDSSNRPIEAISQLVRENKIESAQKHLRLYLFEQPSCVQGRLAAAAICISEGQLDAAIKELQSVYMRHPTNTIALYALGHCYERKGRQDQAVEFYQDCLKFRSFLQPPRQRLAAIYFKNGQTEKAIDEYELLRNEYPDDISTLITLGHLYITTERFSNAIDAFNTAILIHPDNFSGNDENIEQLVADGMFEEAARQLEDLIERQPQRIDLIVRLADVLNMLGLYPEAIEKYEEAARLRPDCLEAMIKLGTQYLQIGDEVAAAERFNGAFEINDQVIDSYIGLAIAQKLAGSETEALETTALASAIYPNGSLLFAQTAILQFRNNIGQSPFPDSFESENMLEKVIEAHKKQIADESENPDLYYRLGILMTSAGNFNEAIALFQKAVEINPMFNRAKNKLALCLFETDRKNEALQLFDRPVFSKSTLDLYYRIALLYCDKIKFATSMMNLLNQHENNLMTSNATINISIILQNLGLLDRTTAMWDNLANTTKHAF